MSFAVGEGQAEAEDVASKATLMRFAKPKPYERWAELAAFAVAMLFLWPFALVWILFSVRPDLNDDPKAVLICVPMFIAFALTVRLLTRFGSWWRRAIIRSGVVKSLSRSGKPISGDFVGISYSERILNLNRGVDWDFGFLSLGHDGLRFEGDRSSFLLNHDCVETTELKQYRLPREGWFVRLFVRWAGQSESLECFSVCSQDGGMPKPARHELTEIWKRRIEDWRWNHMGSPVSHAPELPVDSSPVDNAISRRVPIPANLNRASWTVAIACTLPLAALMCAAMFLFGWDWGGGVVAVIVVYCPVIFRALFLRRFGRVNKP